MSYSHCGAFLFIQSLKSWGVANITSREACLSVHVGNFDLLLQVLCKAEQDEILGFEIIIVLLGRHVAITISVARMGVITLFLHPRHRSTLVA